MGDDASTAPGKSILDRRFHQMSKAKNLCFYSNKDPWSKAFLEELGKTPWMRDFTFVCADPGPNGVRPTLPKWLKQVPTLVIDGDKEPVKTDTEVMNWLYERKMRDMPKKSTGPTAGAAASPALGGEPESWVSGEMSGFARGGYSYIDSDTSATGDGGHSMPGSFSFLNGGSGPGDRQSQSAAASQPKTRKEKQFEEQMALYKEQRDAGMKPGLNRI